MPAPTGRGRGRGGGSRGGGRGGATASRGGRGGASGGAAKSTICRTFQNTGSCKFGEHCRFSHNVGAAPAGAAPPAAAPAKATMSAEEIAAKKAEQARIMAQKKQQEADRVAAAEAAKREKEAAAAAADATAASAAAAAESERLSSLAPQLAVLDAPLAVLDNKKAKKEVRLAAVDTLTKLVADASYEPFLVTVALPALLPRLDDKMKPVADAVAKLFSGIVDMITAHAVLPAADIFCTGLVEEAKWRCKTSCLRALIALMKKHSEQCKIILPQVIPAICAVCWDTRPEVMESSEAAIVTAGSIVGNSDIEPTLPAIYTALRKPEETPESIYALASTAFVQTVDTAALAIVVPLLVRGFREKKTAVKRQCAVIVNNMSKLVESPHEASPFLPELLPSVERATTEISDPEARTVAERAHAQLLRIKKAADADTRDNKQMVLDSLHGALKDESMCKRFSSVLDYASCVGSSLLHAGNTDLPTWQAQLAPMLGALGRDNTPALVEELLNLTRDAAAKAAAALDVGEDDELEELCNCKFTLAYGTKILLHNTGMRLHRGRLYGLLGANDCGKTTLMRAMANGSLEGFPSHLKTVFVESDIQGEMSHLSCIDYIFSDEAIKQCGASRADVEGILGTVGFSEKMIGDEVSTLSGGWRMKLALARAMLQKADIMLMDGPTAHLDVINVQWVKDYLKSLKNVTCIIVSHEPSLLEECCQHILHFQDLKLGHHRGSFSSFVELYPASKTFFDYTETKTKFTFPKPTPIDGIKSRGRALMKMAGVSFTYPGNEKPTLTNISVQVSMASRVACVGRNGAGKSTMIKLLTGELKPAVGNVWQHQATRIAYIAQHAFHHIESHLDKSANEYIRWRYEFGEDKEALTKATNIVTEEEAAALAKPIMVDITDSEGNTKKMKRTIERLAGGRRQGKREYEYEIKWLGMPAASNTFLKASKLEELGFAKHMRVADIKAEAREGAYARPLTQGNVERHLQDIGLAPEWSTHTRMGALSDGQKVKVVFAAALWYQPHIAIFDEPTNMLDRDGLGALVGAINEFEGGVVLISHDEKFCTTLCPETWVLEHGTLNCEGDPEWMKNAMKQAVDSAQIEEMVDANGNVVKVKQAKKTLSRKEMKARARRKKLAIEAGQPWEESDSEDDDF